MNLRNVLAFGAVVACLAVPSIASAQRMGRGGMGGWRGGSVVRTVPGYRGYAAPAYGGYAAPAYYPQESYYTAPAPVYGGYTGYGYGAPVYRGGFERGGFERGHMGGWGRGGRR